MDLAAAGVGGGWLAPWLVRRHGGEEGEGRDGDLVKGRGERARERGMMKAREGRSGVGVDLLCFAAPARSSSPSAGRPGQPRSVGGGGSNTP